MTQGYSPNATVQVRTTGKPDAVIATVRGEVQSLAPNLAITNVQTIHENHEPGPLGRPGWERRY